MKILKWKTEKCVLLSSERIIDIIIVKIYESESNKLAVVL